MSVIAGVLLLFLRGHSLETVHLSGGTIPPHDGHGPVHVAFSIAADERGWAAGTIAGTYMVAWVNFASTYSLTIGGWTFPGYSLIPVCTENPIRQYWW